MTAAATTPGQQAARRTYEPYGETRAESGTFQSDRGFLGQVTDSSTNLSYLNARYHDPTTGIFISADPLYDTSKPKSLNPYTYGMANPTSRSDPSGMSPLDTFVLEGQVNSLLNANTQLVNEVKRLGGVINELQSFIKKQQNTIKQLLTYIGTLESFIRQQQSVIDQLQSRVAYLTRQVNYWRNKAVYYRGVIDDLRGQLSVQAQNNASLMDSAVHNLGAAEHWRQEHDNLQEDYDTLEGAFNNLYDDYLSLTDPAHMDTFDAGCFYAAGGETWSSDNSLWGNLTGAIWQGVQWTPVSSAMSNVCYLANNGG